MTAAPLDALAIVGAACIVLGTFYAWLLWYLRLRPRVWIPLVILLLVVVDAAMQAAK